MSVALKPIYEETIMAIKAACESINVSFTTAATDGRISSAMKESEYLTTLKTALPAHFTIEIAKDRHWYDVRINDIPINLKLTTGGTDNAFNKVALIYTITGVEPAKRNMNFNELWAHLKHKATPKKRTRDRQTEYHYLVVDKSTGRTLSNPSLTSTPTSRTHAMICKSTGPMSSATWTITARMRDIKQKS